MVICLEQGAYVHMAQLMPLLLTVSCFRKIQVGFTFLVLAHPGNPGKRAIKRVCVAQNRVVLRFKRENPCKRLGCRRLEEPKKVVNMPIG